jgi:hypothetical protein
MGDDAARADHAAVPDRHTRQNDRSAANPYGLTMRIGRADSSPDSRVCLSSG